MTHEEWLRTHAFLDPVAQLLGRVESSLAAIDGPAPVPPPFDAYAADYEAGVPLLHSADAALDLLPAGTMTCALVDALAAGSASDDLTACARTLATELGRGPRPTQRVADWLLGDDAFAPSSPGLLRYLGWTAITRYLRPVLAAFARWRDEDRWLRRHCPTCGALPAMAQLVGVDPGRKRLLSCGCCSTRWRYRRTACPFCENDSHRLGVVAVQAEAGLRIDYCEACRGYLKTYAGQGHEAVLLADWTSLHLDVIAHERDLKRMAVSLYDLEPLLLPYAPPE